MSILTSHDVIDELAMAKQTLFRILAVNISKTLLADISFVDASCVVVLMVKVAIKFASKRGEAPDLEGSKLGCNDGKSEGLLDLDGSDDG